MRPAGRTEKKLLRQGAQRYAGKCSKRKNRAPKPVT
jgi:hypothetical protein